MGKNRIAQRVVVLEKGIQFLYVRLLVRTFVIVIVNFVYILEGIQTLHTSLYFGHHILYAWLVGQSFPLVNSRLCFDVIYERQIDVETT